MLAQGPTRVPPDGCGAHPHARWPFLRCTSSPVPGCWRTTRRWPSIRNRFPYLDPLNVLQAELLRRIRAGDDDELTRRGILITINGLATGLRNSG